MNVFAILASVSSVCGVAVAFAVHPSNSVVDTARGVVATLMLAMMDVMLIYPSSGRAMYTLAFACGANAFVRGGEGIACVSLYVFTSLMLSFIADRVEWGVLHATALVSCAFFVGLSTWHLSELQEKGNLRCFSLRMPTAKEMHGSLAVVVFAFADALDCNASPLIVASAFVYGINAVQPRGAVTALSLSLLVLGIVILLFFDDADTSGCRRGFLAANLSPLAAFSLCFLHEYPSAKDTMVLSLLVSITGAVSCIAGLAMSTTTEAFLLFSSLFVLCVLVSLFLLLALHHYSSTAATTATATTTKRARS